ncbi:MAG: hypothetical protein ACXW33_10300, partial [Sulfuricurvum sp.]
MPLSYHAFVLFLLGGAEWLPSMMVQDVSNASREQMQGIGQINTAVTQLDQMTQENAKIAAEADSIANATIDKAQAMVEDASSKNFVGK